MAPPPSQKDRPICFFLRDEDAGTVLGSHTLVLRPEDLTRQAPSRIAITQTLGGGWADVWGGGLQTINISGHTGWRGGETWGQAVFLPPGLESQGLGRDNRKPLAEWQRQVAAGIRPNAMDLKKQFNRIKYLDPDWLDAEGQPWLRTIHRDAHAQPFANLAKAWRRYFEQRRAGKQAAG